VKGRTRQFSHDSGCASAAALRFALCAHINNIRYIGTFVNADADVPAHFILFRLTFAQIYPYQIAPKCRPMIGIPVAWPSLRRALIESIGACSDSIE
jgi:hypothetical protein